MRRIIFGLLMLWAALFGACQASAQLMMTGAGRGAPSSGGGSKSYTFVSSQSYSSTESANCTGNTTATFSCTVSLPAGSVFVVIGLGTQFDQTSGTTLGLNGPSVGSGLTAGPVSTGGAVGIYYGTVTGGSNITLSVSNAGSAFTERGLTLWYATGVSTIKNQNSAVGSGGSQTTLSLTGASSGDLIFAYTSNGAFVSGTENCGGSSTTQTPARSDFQQPLTGATVASCDWTASSGGTFTVETALDATTVVLASF